MSSTVLLNILDLKANSNYYIKKIILSEAYFILGICYTYQKLPINKINLFDFYEILVLRTFYKFEWLEKMPCTNIHEI